MAMNAKSEPSTDPSYNFKYHTAPAAAPTLKSTSGGVFASLGSHLLSARLIDRSVVAQDGHTAPKTRFGKSYMSLFLFGGPSGIRTPDPLIKSQLLCQLS